MQDFFFLGGLHPEFCKEEIFKNSKTMPSFAADSHQKAIIQGLENNGAKLTIINSMHIGSYPYSYRKLLIRGYKWSHNNISEDLNIGFLNFFGLKNVIRSILLTCALFRSIRVKSSFNGKECDKVILSYGLHAPFLIASYINRRIFKKSVRWCLIVPEIPKFYIEKKGKGFLYKNLKTIDWKITEKLLRKGDCFELITKNMAKFLKIEDKPFIVIEAIAKTSERIGEMSQSCKSGDIGENINFNNNFNDNDKVIIYSGSTHLKFGIKSLLETFVLIKQNNYKLFIFGGGTGEDLIRKYSKIDNRIVYMGFLEREKVLNFYKNATIFVNPRTAEGEYTKYSFPSKTLEYMLSGKPVLMHRLRGIPDEYDGFLKYFKGSDVESMAEDIMEICELPKGIRNDFGKKARNFILTKKNEKIQGEKLFKMLSDLS